MNDTTSTLDGLIGRMPKKTTDRMPVSVKWQPVGRGNSRWAKVLVLRAWRGVEIGEVVAVYRADLWRLQNAGAVFEFCRVEDEDYDAIIVGDRVVPVVHKQAPDPDVEGEVIAWGELNFADAIPVPSR